MKCSKMCSIILRTPERRRIMAYSLVIFLIFMCISCVQCSGFDSQRTCEPIRIDICRGVGYNMTGMPNMAGHELQVDAKLQLETFTPLIQYGCSSQLRFFLCAVYTPMCTDKVPQLIGPCRPLCENVKARCQPVLQEFGFPWPASLNCSKFPPKNNHRHMCMEGPQPEEHEKQPSVYGTFNQPTFNSPNFNSPNFQSPNLAPSVPNYNPSYTSTGSKRKKKVKDKESSKRHYGLCHQYKYVDQYYFINSTGRCAHNCTADILFTHENKGFAEYWTAAWSCLCFLSTSFTLLKFLSNSSRYRYPERIIILLAANYNVYSIAYFIRLIAGRDNVSCHVDSQHQVSILVQEGLDNANCTIIFVLLYFFGMASTVWWVILTITWFLSSGLHWSSEAIQRKCSYFHLTAWGLPALKTIAILVMRLIDADELTGTCYVGQQSDTALMWFVIVPSAIYLSIGALFLVLGVIGHLKKSDSIPTRVRHESCHSIGQSNGQHLLSHNHRCGGSHSGSFTGSHLVDKHDIIITRIGIFALFYIIPSSCVLGANLYEYISRDSWYSVQTPLNSIIDRPNVEIFTLKIFMSLVIGIKTGLWIWSSKAPAKTIQHVGAGAGGTLTLPLTLNSPFMNGAPTKQKQSKTSKNNSSKERFSNRFQMVNHHPKC